MHSAAESQEPGLLVLRNRYHNAVYLCGYNLSFVASDQGSGVSEGVLLPVSMGFEV